ncbi:type II toxin-antitoxin system RelE/ParE family toxin [Escherichia coli]|uniref:type II toxin-antitoxin system RelE/ParE family toxin n=1 Tax=Escherichia coli TaxID=562 RepID=UPI003159CE96
MEIFWTMLARQDRKRIREYIAEQNLMAAIELDERIGYSASSLAGQPYKGLYTAIIYVIQTYLRRLLLSDVKTNVCVH